MVDLNLSTHPQFNANVFASAGSGKTWLLITRICRLLLAGTEPQHILAITFTRKSAAEMRARLFDKLASWSVMEESELIHDLEMINEELSDEKIIIARNLYEKLLFSAQAIRISTFHAFCEEIIRAFPLESDLPTTFELTEYEHVYINQAWQRLLNENEKPNKHKLNSALQTLFEFCFGLNGTKSALISFLYSRSEWLAFTKDAENEATYAYDQLINIIGDVDPDLANNWLTSESVTNSLVKYKKILETSPTKTYQAWAEKISACLTIKNHDNKVFLSQLKSIFLTTENKPRKLTISKTWHKLINDEQAELVTLLHNEFCEKMLALQDQQVHSELISANKAWYFAGNTFLKIYQKVKFEHGVIDFSDLEWETYRLLQHEDHALWVQYKLGQRIQHFLVDEFQDTNPIQWHLLKPLIESSQDLNETERNSLFLVGDIKQSIYRFRGANPEIQTLAAKWSQQAMNSQQISTDHSWRSSPAVIDCVNRIFTHPSVQNNCLTFNTHSYQHNERWGLVKIYPLIEINTHPEREQFRNPLTTAGEDKQHTAHYREGVLIAQQILKLINENTPIYEGSEIRAAQLKDILILTRTRSHLDELKAGLIHTGISVNSNDPVSLLSFMEIKDILALLTCLVDPYDDLALVQLLCSPIFNIKEKLLVELRKTQADTWKQKLDKTVADNPSVNSLKIAQEKLHAWQAYADKIPVHDLLNYIYSDWDIHSRYRNALPKADAEHACARLDQLLQQCLDIESGRYSSIMRFIRNIKQINPDTIYTSDSNINAVNIMTVHGAKGLEASIVFIADSGPYSAPTEHFKALSHWPADSDKPHIFMLACKKSAMSKAALELKQHSQNTSDEELNLLYVALTRAKQILIMSGVQAKRCTQQGWHQQCCQALGIEFDENCAWEHENVNKPDLTLTTDTPKQQPNSDFDAVLFEPVKTDSKEDFTLDIKQPITLQAKEGIIIHKLLEILSKQPNLSDEALLYRTNTETAFNLTLENLTSLKQEALNCILHPELREIFRSDDCRHVFHEVTIADSDSQDMINVIDHMIVSDKGVWIIDYKSQQDVSEENASRESLKYAKQLNRYAQAVKPIYKTLPIRCSVLFTKITKLVDVIVQT